MPDEALISQIENILSEVVELGGANERSSIVPNLTVQDANPTNLDGWIIVSDDRDGDNILAKKVPSVVYTNSDLVNVLFPRGGEAVAFQQGSQSAGGDLWEIVPSTTTDIFYNKGDVGIGKSVAPDARLEILDAAQAQLRLTHTEDTKYATLTLDTNHDLTIKPSSTGQIILQPTTDSADFFQVLDADGGTPIFNVDSTNEKVGFGTATIPHGGVGVAKLAIDGTDSSAAGPHIQLTTASDDYPLLQGLLFAHDNVAITLDGYLHSDLAWKSSDAGSNYQIYKVSDILRIRYDSGVAQGAAVTWNEGISLNTAGKVGIKSIAPIDTLDVNGTIGTHLDGNTSLTLSQATTDTVSASFVFKKSRGTHASPTATASGDLLGQEIWQGYDGAAFQSSAVLRVLIDGAVSAGVVPSKLVYQTTDTAGSRADRVTIKGSGDVGVGIGTPAAQLHVDQPSTTAAQPVIYLDQADVSEEMIQFETTIGTGNAIEAVGAKTLTVTHFIKVTLPGALTRYIPAGTIA